MTEWLTLCVTAFDSNKQINLLLIQCKQSSGIQTSKTGGQPYSYTSAYKVVFDGPGYENLLN